MNHRLMGHDLREHLSGIRRIVVKVGTAVVTHPDGRLALGRLGGLVEQLHELRRSGREVLLVTSGSIGLGVHRLGLPTIPTRVVDRQACAAAGQGALVALYDGLMRQLGEVGAQVLLTEEDFLDRSRYVKLHATLERLLELGAIPIVNENDTVSTAEIALGENRVFGDNDRLSALVAAGADAELLVMLTNVEGVLTGPPGTPGATRVPVYGPDTRVRFGKGTDAGRGGMEAKIAAAKVAARSGTHVVVASGHVERIVPRVVAGEDLGTLFPARLAFNKRRQWLAYASSPAGRLVVNDGARRALVENGASLLAAGVEAVEGDFEAGAVVSVVTAAGREFARGLCARSSEEARRERAREKGGRSRALVHRNDVVILHLEEDP